MPASDPSGPAAELRWNVHAFRRGLANLLLLNDLGAERDQDGGAAHVTDQYRVEWTHYVDHRPDGDASAQGELQPYGRMSMTFVRSGGHPARTTSVTEVPPARPSGGSCSRLLAFCVSGERVLDADELKTAVPGGARQQDESISLGTGPSPPTRGRLRSATTRDAIPRRLRPGRSGARPGRRS